MKGEPMGDCMNFPDTVDEYMEQYKMTDVRQVYSNGIEYVPIFRMKQWFEHEKDQPTIQPVATDINVGDKISKFIDGLEEIFADLRERHVDDSICGLCEYDGAYMGQSGDWCNECPGFDRDDCFKLSDDTRKKWTDEIIKALPTVQPEERTETHGVCLDAISRQQAIDALDCINGVEEVLRSLPPAQPEPPWIPCSERLPEEYGEYLVTKRIIGWNCEEYDVNDIAYFDDDGFPKADRVIAWMPLPEPYKPNNA